MSSSYRSQDSTASDRTAGVSKFVVLVLLALVVAELLSAFETTMAIQMLYSPKPVFEGAEITSLGWIVTAFMLSGGMSVAFAGRLGDQFGRQRVLIVVILISLVGSVVSALAPNIGVLVAGRAIQGVAGAVLPLAFGIVRELLPTALHGLGIAVISTTALVAGASGMLVGGVILDHSTWHFIFWTSSVLALIAAVVVKVFVPFSRPDATGVDTRVDYLGGVVFGSSVAAVLYGITVGGRDSWTDTQSWGLIVGGVVGLAIWSWWELRIDYPMIQLRRFGNRKFALGMLATALLAAGPIGMSSIFIVAISRTPQSVPTADGSLLNLPVGLGMTATMAGLVGLVGAAVAFMCSPLIGRLASKSGARTTIAFGCVLSIVACCVIWINPGSAPITIAGFWIMSLGTGFTYSGMPTIIAESVTTPEVSAATGLNVVVRTVFQGVASAIVAVLLAINTIEVGGGATVMSRTGFNWVIGAMILMSLLAIVTVACVRPTRTSEQAHEELEGAVA